MTAKPLTSDRIDQLFGLRSNLLRRNRNLARPSGSDASHNEGVRSELGMNAMAAGAAAKRDAAAAA